MLLVSDAEQRLFAPDEQPAPGDCRGSLDFFAERVFGEDFKLRGGGQDDGFALVIGDIDPAPGDGGGSGEGAADALAVEDFAPPDLGPWAKRELASSVFWSWLVIGVIYSGWFVTFRHEPPTSLQRSVPGASRNVRLRIIAGDTLQPVEGVGVRYTLIGDDGGDGGDGGHAEDFTSADGCALLTGYCGPGCYQIHLMPPARSRFRGTAYTSPETLLMVAKDGSYHPAEYRIAILND
ncbi:MAG: hypothetical protein V4675_03200 [Verrucomicrobiota bacterium]